MIGLVLVVMVQSPIFWVALLLLVTITLLIRNSALDFGPATVFEMCSLQTSFPSAISGLVFSATPREISSYRAHCFDWSLFSKN